MDLDEGISEVAEFNSNRSVRGVDGFFFATKSTAVDSFEADAEGGGFAKNNGGESLGVLYGAANRDEAEFPQASSCVLDRRRNPHLAFGVGVHTCLGAHLARLDLRVAIRQLLLRIPDFSLDAEPVWAPNGDTRGFRSLQIRFTPSELPASSNTMGNSA